MTDLFGLLFFRLKLKRNHTETKRNNRQRIEKKMHKPNQEIQQRSEIVQNRSKIPSKRNKITENNETKYKNHAESADDLLRSLFNKHGGIGRALFQPTFTKLV